MEQKTQPIFKEGSYELCASDPQGSNGASGAMKIKLDASSQLKVKHSWSRQKGQSMGMELSTAKWGFEAFSNNDIALERKMKTRLGEIRVKQYIPAHKEWLVPSPEVKMIASPLDVPKWKLKDELEFAYDFQKSFGRLEEEIEYNKRYKVRLATDTEKGLKGATMGLTAKLQRPYVHSIGMNLSRAAGATLKYEVNFGEDDLVKAKANWKLKGNEACLELQPKISEQARLTMKAMGKPDGSKPKILLGMKCEM
mmetsp:Transcript_27971/g.75540  ORF Transcript_27971/g.75540 Transcript_27971/m.75540 type:complete len:253 (+) Transcript_27971:59-817(+)